MTEIKYVVGDMFPIIAAMADRPTRIVIPHVCNDVGAWGAGFVVPLGKNFPKAKSGYLDWFKTGWKMGGSPFLLGENQWIRINDQVSIMNMVAQKACGHDSTGRPPVRYTALSRCMQQVGSLARSLDVEIHAPAFGSDLAGGDWNFIEELIKECWCDLDLPVTIYSLKPIKRKSQIGPAICSDEDADYVGDPIKEGGAELLTDIPIDDLLV
jgi:hypothetical protein